MGNGIVNVLVCYDLIKVYRGGEFLYKSIGGFREVVVLLIVLSGFIFGLF